ncbi:hypothetical protein [Desulfofundulus sp.]|uniref:hypothetical protein n=1 Tax=Desulfofundulus sp. TaxID=2282750 RepID=UPI003C740E4E
MRILTVVRTVLLSLLLFIAILFAGCSRNTAEVDRDQVHGASSMQDQRFKIVYEHPETKYLGGFTVLRDNVTGQEYLIITGLNGAPTVVPLQRSGTTGQSAGLSTTR